MGTNKENFRRRGFDLLALGEILLRLSPPVNERLTRGLRRVSETGWGRRAQRRLRRITSGAEDRYHLEGSRQ